MTEVPVTEPDSAAIRAIAEMGSTVPGGLLPILHEIQDRFGYVPEAAVPIVAEVLNLSRAEVHGVLSFYHLYRRTPPGKHTIYLCRAEACQAMGGRALESHVKQRLAVGYHETTADGRYSLEPIYCLGNCACSPAIMIDETVHGRVSLERFDEIVGEAEL